jgi:flavin-dependent dehydrogenase
VSEATLLLHLHGVYSPPQGPGDSSWTIRANRAASQNVEEHSFGDRQATAYAVRLKPEASQETCWIESLVKGWLFLLPEGAGRARLLAIGDLDGDGLSQSRLIAKQIDVIDGPGTTFPSQPRIAVPLCGPQWIACGSAAVSFDPVCGEGAGHALREAILANAVIQAALAGANPDDLLHHYRTRIVAGFARHLQTCVEFYVSGHQGPWWDEQLSGLNEGLAWCRAQLEHQSQPKFRLQNFALESF